MHALNLLESPCGSTHSLEESTHLNKLHLSLYYTIVDNLEKEWCQMQGNLNAPGTSPRQESVKEKGAKRGDGLLAVPTNANCGAGVGFCNRRKKNDKRTTVKQ